MKHIYRKLPLPTKLILIGLLPILFLILVSVQFYNMKSQQVRLIGDYIDEVDESIELSRLVSALQAERRFSYEFALKKTNFDSVRMQRVATDSAISRLKQSEDLAIKNFPQYTFIDELPQVRMLLDTSSSYDPRNLMDFYNTAILRLNTLNSAAPASNVYLSSVYQDLISQNLLFEMTTYLGIIKTNIYNALYTRENTEEILLATLPLKEIYNTYETEFLMKSSNIMLMKYRYLRANADLESTIDYVHQIFETFSIDSLYTAETWWNTSTNGIAELRDLQKFIWESIEVRMNNIYSREIKLKNEALLVLIILFVVVIAFTAYAIKVITNMLGELKIGAEKIAKGNVNVRFNNMPKDVIGEVAGSIDQISENNKRLVYAAEAIGKGNFAVEVAPRSDDDILVQSIVQMKKNLQEYALQKDRIQNETLDLVHKKDDFMSIASHELKTPVATLKAYTQLLQMESEKSGNEQQRLMFEKMDAQINKLTLLINGLLDSSKLREGELIYNRQNFEFNELVVEVVDEIQRTSQDNRIDYKTAGPAFVYADRERIGQVLSNLLTNAIKYCVGCDIQVTVTLDHNSISCSVRDFGIGIEEDQHEKIFERFYRVSGLNSHTYPGLGLGLYISKEIIKRHSGTIWVESEPGKGTTFHFSLPVVQV